MENTEEKLLSLLETAWGIIANANGGDWDAAERDREGWKEAAERWRDNYFATLDHLGILSGG